MRRMRNAPLQRVFLFGIAGIAAAVVLFLTIPSGVASAKPPLGKRWNAAQQIPLQNIDHSAFDQLLQKYVDHDGSVEYRSWQQSTQDRQLLLGYLEHLSRADLRQQSSRPAMLAFWINAYNAITLEGILQVYPTTSIRNHTSRLGGFNIWHDLPLLVGNQQYTLDQIEHKILRKMGEPRIHFAIVCASVGCPRLLNRSYTADAIEQQLAENAADFFRRPKNFQIEKSQNTIRMSAIVDWFADDFGKDQAERIAYLRPYLPENARQVASNRATKIEYLEYDWSLNEQPPRSR